MKERWKLISSCDLPIRLKKEFDTYTEAYIAACEWNRFHDAKDMALPEQIFDEQDFAE